MNISQMMRLSRMKRVWIFSLSTVQVVAFRGTDSHSWYNWAENMKFWRSDFGLPFPGAEGALVHSGE